MLAFGWESGMALAWIFWLLVLVGLGALVYAFLQKARWPRGDAFVPSATPDPLHILKSRYARGEITRDEFQKMKQDLEEGP
jgi:putative membrane protein